MISLIEENNKKIMSNYADNINEHDVEAVCRRGIFLGCCEQLVRILHRNTDNIPLYFKQFNYYYEIVVTYVDLYCDLLVKPRFANKYPNIEKDIAAISIAKFFNDDYNIIDVLPPSSANQTAQWITKMKKIIKIFGIHSDILILILEGFSSELVGEPVHFKIADNFKATLY